MSNFMDNLTFQMDINKLRDESKTEHTGKKVQEDPKQKIRITNLCNEDKLKIVNLVEELAKKGEEKQKYITEIKKLQNENQTLKFDIVKLKKINAQETQILLSKITELEIETELLKSKNKIEINKLQEEKQNEITKIIEKNKLDMKALEKDMKRAVNGLENESKTLVQKASNEQCLLAQRIQKLQNALREKNSSNEILIKENLQYECKCNDYKLKLALAVETVKKLKNKVKNKINPDSTANQETQTYCNDESSDKEFVVEKKIKSTKSKEAILSDTENEIFSNLFFTNNELPPILDTFFIKPPSIATSSCLLDMEL